EATSRGNEQRQRAEATSRAADTRCGFVSNAPPVYTRNEQVAWSLGSPLKLRGRSAVAPSPGDRRRRSARRRNGGAGLWEKHAADRNPSGRAPPTTQLLNGIIRFHQWLFSGQWPLRYGWSG